VRYRFNKPLWDLLSFTWMRSFAAPAAAKNGCRTSAPYSKTRRDRPPVACLSPGPDSTDRQAMPLSFCHGQRPRPVIEFFSILECGFRLLTTRPLRAAVLPRDMLAGSLDPSPGHFHWTRSLSCFCAPPFAQQPLDFWNPFDWHLIDEDPPRSFKRRKLTKFSLQREKFPGSFHRTCT